MHFHALTEVSRESIFATRNFAEIRDASRINLRLPSDLYYNVVLLNANSTLYLNSYLLSNLDQGLY